MENDLISRKTMKEMGATCFARRNENGKLEAIISLDNAPTVKPVWCDECEKALTCEKRKNTEIDGCYEGIKVGDT